MSADWAAIGNAVAGTIMTVPEIADRFEVLEDEVEEMLAAEAGVEVCVECGWWFFDYGEHDQPTCEDCEAP